MVAERQMSPDQRVDGVVLEYLLSAGTPRQWQLTPQAIIDGTRLPRRQVAASINRLRSLGWIRWETVPINRLPGWRLTEVGAMAAADHPRPYWRDEGGTIWVSRIWASEHCDATEVILAPSEFAALPEG